ARQAPSFSLPAPGFPTIVDLATTDPEKALAALQSQRRAETAIEADVLRAHLLTRVGRFAESAQAWREVAAAEPALDEYARRAAATAHVAGGNAGAAHELLKPLLAGSSPESHT